MTISLSGATVMSPEDPISNINNNWVVTKPNGATLDTMGSDSMGLREAINYRATDGGPLIVMGYGSGKNLPNKEPHYIQANIATPIVIPASYEGYIRLIDVILAVQSTGDGIVIDSTEQDSVEQQGGKYIFTSSAPGAAAIHMITTGANNGDGEQHNANGKYRFDFIWVKSAPGLNQIGLLCYSNVPYTGGPAPGIVQTGIELGTIITSRDDPLAGTGRQAYAMLVRCAYGNGFVGNTIRATGEFTNWKTACVQVGLPGDYFQSMTQNGWDMAALQPCGDIVGGAIVGGDGFVTNENFSRHIFASANSYYGPLNRGLLLTAASGGNNCMVSSVGASVPVLKQGVNANYVISNGAPV